MNNKIVSIETAVSTIISAGLSAVVQPNNSGDRQPNHIKIIGGVRHVEFWNTTGTVFANRTKDKQQIKTSGLINAIRIAKGESHD